MRLQGEHLVFAGLALGHEADGLLLVRPECQAAVGDLLPVGDAGPNGVGVAVAETLHHGELRDQIVEAARREDDVDDAGIARLVDVEGARRELLIGEVQIVLGDLEQTLVLLDLLAD